MEKKNKKRFEKRCFCGNVIVVMAETEPKEFECSECKRKGKWDEKFVYPKPESIDFKQEELPAPVFLEGKPHFIIDNHYVSYDEGIILFLERRIAKDQERINNLKTKAGNKGK